MPALNGNPLPLSITALLGYIPVLRLLDYLPVAGFAPFFR